MAKAVRFHEHGGPEVLVLEDVAVAAPGPGYALVRHAAIGVNYIDIYHRSGIYPLPLPSGLGSEAAGIVESVGEGVRNVKPGDRVAYAVSTPGSYGDVRGLPADRLVKLPSSISFEVAASAMLKGLTVHYLIH